MNHRNGGIDRWYNQQIKQRRQHCGGKDGYGKPAMTAQSLPEFVKIKQLAWLLAAAMAMSSWRLLIPYELSSVCCNRQSLAPHLNSNAHTDCRATDVSQYRPTAVRDGNLHCSDYATSFCDFQIRIRLCLIQPRFRDPGYGVPQPLLAPIIHKAG